MRTDEPTLLSLLKEEDAAGLSPTTAGPWVHSWHEALEQLETKCRFWRDLVPLHVEPAFRAQIAEAFRAGTRQRHFNDHRWAAVLLDIRPSPGRGRRSGDDRRTLGEHPDKGGLIVAKKGYVSHNNDIFAKIPADKTPDTITLEEAVSLLDARAKARQRRAMANQGEVGVLDTGIMQVRVSFSKNHHRIGLSVVVRGRDAVMLNVSLNPNETGFLTQKLFGKRDAVMLDTTAGQVRLSTTDTGIDLSVAIPARFNASLSLTPPEADHLANLLLQAMVSGGFLPREAAERWRRDY